MNIGNSVKAAKNVVTSKAGRQLLKGQKHSPTILFGAGVIGVVATTVLASKATLRLEDILNENERKQGEAEELLRNQPQDYSAKDHTKDMAVLKVRLCKDVARLYAPAVAVGVMSIGALTGSHVILSKRHASVVAAYATLDKGFRDYQERVAALVGPEKARELRFESEQRGIAVDTEKGTKVETITSAKTDGPGSPYAKLFSKETSQSWDPRPEYNLMFLRFNQNWANDTLKAKGHLFLNEVYDQLGLDRTPAGQAVGWVYNNPKGGDDYVDFGFLDDSNAAELHDFMTGREGAIWLDFNVDGVVYDLI